MEKYDGGSLVGHVNDILAVAKQAHAAGDGELSRRLIAHCRSIENDRGIARGTMTLVLRDGRRVPVHAAASHIRRGGKPIGTQTRRVEGSTPLAREMRRLSAECRKLASEAGRSRIDAVLNAPDRSRQRSNAQPFEINGDEFDELDFLGSSIG